MFTSGIRIAAASTLFVVGMVSVASAQASGDGAHDEAKDPPRGPRVDFCPSQEQIKAHEERYDFGYKPTVACKGDQEVKAPTTDSDPNDTENELTKREEIERLRNAKAIPNDDPLRIEGELPNGEHVNIHVMGDPKLFDDMTPAEYADVLEDELEPGGKQ